MARTKAAEVIVFDPPPFATLEPPEVDAAIEAGSLQGIIDAIRARTPHLDPAGSAPDLAAISAVNELAGSSLARRVRFAIDQYRRGDGAPDQADVLALVARQANAAQLLADAITEAGRWIARNPGTLIDDYEHSGGKRRAFLPA